MERPRYALAAAFCAALSIFVLFGAARPAEATGTAAGTSISNTATATYSDPNNAGLTLNATSNTVSVTVAEVAGITVGGGTPTDTTPGHAGNILPGDTLNYDFTVTNIGNAGDPFALPGSATVTGNGTAGALQYSTNGGTTFTAIPAGGLTTASIAANAVVIVRVPVVVAASATTGDVIKVLLGNTGTNDNAADTQNIADPTPGATDVHTTSTTAQNGLREASYFGTGTVGSMIQSFAQVLLTKTGFMQGATPAQDTLTYALAMNVLSTVPSGAGASHALTAADLVGTPITLNGAANTRILISDAVPSGTTLTGVPVTVSGWTVVYSTSPTSTTPNNAAWVTTAPTDLSTVTRVGYVNSGTLAKGAGVTGLNYTVTTTGASLSAVTSINNIAQALGQTSGDTTNALVYDESGDQDASNFNDDGSRGSNAPTTGVANPAADGTDTAGNNTGTGIGGEDLVYSIMPAGTVLNGPNGHPTAVGPTDNSDDFTNLSTLVPAGTAPGQTIAPGAVTFTNTVQNPGAAAIAGNILLVPQPPATLPGGAATDLPTGTTATLTYNGASAVYTYNGTAWTLTGGTALTIPNLATSATAQYTVAVQLPGGTPLSTDTLKGFPVGILADVDANGNGVVDAGEAMNRTIDRVYTGFLQVVKRARIVDTDGTTVIQNYTTGPSSSNILPGRFIDYQITYANISTPAPSGGSGNGLLNASGTTIFEDGTTGGNNWALDVDGNGVIDTSNVIASAIDSGGGTVAFYNGNPPATGTDRTGTTAATDVTKYVDTFSGPLAPGASHALTFRRKIN